MDADAGVLVLVEIPRYCSVLDLVRGYCCLVFAKLSVQLCLLFQ